MAGLTDQGLVIKTFEEVYTSLEEKAKELFADVTPQGDQVDTSENTVLGRMIGIAANGEYDMWEALQYVHDSFNPNTATGIALDNIVAIGGLQRLQAQPTSVPMLLIGKKDFRLTTDFKVSSTLNRVTYSLAIPITFTPVNICACGIEPLGVAIGSQHTLTFNFTGVEVDTITLTYTSETDDVEEFIQDWVDFINSNFGGATLVAQSLTLSDTTYLYIVSTNPYSAFTLTVPLGGAITYVAKIVTMFADELGAIEQPVNTIDIVVGYPDDSTDLIVPYITNINSGIKGRLAETDEELRERFRNTKFKKAANILDSMRDALRELEGVKDVMIYENDLDVAVNGIPPHSFMAVVLGGEENQIAKTIWTKKPLGIPSFGDTYVTVFDSQGLPKIIGYQKPEVVDISVSVTVTKIGEMSSAAGSIIKQNIIDFTNSLYNIGDDVIYSRYYTPINRVEGHYVNSLTIGVVPSNADPSDPDWGDWEDTDNISIGQFEVARIKPEHIRVTVIE